VAKSKSSGIKVAKSAGDAGDAAKTSSHLTGQESDGATLTGCAESYIFLIG